jgi:hypothetical protein
MKSTVSDQVPRSYRDQVSSSINIAVLRMQADGSTRHEALTRLENIFEEVLAALNGVNITSVSHLRRQLADVRTKLTAEYNGARFEVSTGNER